MTGRLGVVQDEGVTLLGDLENAYFPLEEEGQIAQAEEHQER